jgi:hypothetical protein
LAALAAAQGWRLTTYLKAACAVADVPLYVSRLRRVSWECARWRAWSLAEIVRLHPDAVIIAQFSRGYVQAPGSRLHGHGVALEQWRAGLIRTVQTLRGAGIAVILLQDSPTPAGDIPLCLARAAWHGTPRSRCDIARAQAFDPALIRITRAVAARTGSHYVDLTARFCGPQTCPAILKGDIVYRDDSHLTARYAARLQQALGAALRPGLTAAMAAPKAGCPPAANRCAAASL